MKGFLLDENLPTRLRFTPSLPVVPLSTLGASPTDTAVRSAPVPGAETFVRHGATILPQRLCQFARSCGRDGHSPTLRYGRRGSAALLLSDCRLWKEREQLRQFGLVRAPAVFANLERFRIFHLPGGLGAIPVGEP